MQIRLSKKTVIVALVLLIALLAAVMTVSAADVTGGDMTVAKVVPECVEGFNLTPISGTDHRLISPWAIDATSVEV
jgi:hypothetical protein